jgi:hypothetical protein
MAKNSDKTQEAAPAVETPANFPCSVREYCVSKGLNPFQAKVFIKAMEMEQGVGKHAKFLFSDWEARRDEFYKRPAT